MQDQDSREVDQLGRWDEYTSKLRKLLETFHGKLKDLNSTKQPRNVKEVEEKFELTSRLSDEFVAAIPYMRSGYQYGNVLLEDESLADDLKEKIKCEMEGIVDRFQELKSELDDEHIRLESLLEIRPQPSEGKMDWWVEERDKLNDLLHQSQQRYKYLKSQGIPTTREEIKRQLAETEDFLKDAGKSFPWIKQGIDSGIALLFDDDLNDEAKDSIDRDTDHLADGFEQVKRDIIDHFKWLNMLLDQLPPTSRTRVVRFDIPGEMQPLEQHFVESVPINDYIIRMDDNMSPEERRKATKDKKIDKWKEWTTKLDDLVDRMKTKLNKAKAKEKPRNKRDLRDQIDDIKECKEELEDSEPQIKEAMEYANNLLDGDDLDDIEKEEIRLYIAKLTIQLVRIHNEAVEEKHRLLIEQTPSGNDVMTDDQIAEEGPIEHQFRERPELDFNLSEPKYDDMTNQSGRISSGPNVIHVQGYQEEPEDSVLRIRNGMEHNNNLLLGDEDLNEKKKEEMRHCYTSALEIQVSTKDTGVDKHRLFDILEETPHPKKYVVHEHLVEDKPDQQLHERPDCQVESKDDNNKEDQAEETNEVALISSVDKDPIEYHTARLNKDMAPVEKAEKHDRWKDWKDKLDHIQEKLKRKLNRDKSRNPKKCKEESENYELQIREAMEYANDLLSDGDLNDSEKEEMRRYISSLKLQLTTIHNEADDEKDRLDELLDETPYPDAVVVKQHFIQEEPIIDQQLQERPDWQVDCKDMPEKEDEDVHILSVEKVSIHRYILKLQDDMSPEARHETEKAEKRDRWRDWKVKLDDLLVGLKRKLERAKSGSQLRNRGELQEQRNEAKECKGQLEDYEPQIREAMEYADSLLSDGDLDDNEKKEMRRYISTLNLQLLTIHNEADGEKDRLDQLLGESSHAGAVIVEENLVQEEPIDQQFHERPDWHVEFKDEPVHISSVEKESIHHYIVKLQEDMTPEERCETEKAEKRDRWRDWKVKLDDLLVGLKRKLERAKSGSQLRNRKELQEQRNEAKECKGQLEDYEPQIREAMEYADGLLSDGDLDDSEKEQMRRYISTLNLQLMTIHNEADSEKDRLDQQLGESPHLGTVIVEEDLVQEEPIDQQFHERPDWHVEFKDEPVHISSVEKESIHHYIVKLQEETTPEERRETEKAEKRDRWRDWKVKLDDLLVGLKRKLERAKSGSQLRNRGELQEQRNEEKECKGQLEDYEPQIREAMEYADSLLSDGDLDDSEKEQMRRYISTLNLQLMTIHNEADSEKDRLDQLLGESPHLGTVIVEEDLVQEEPIDQQFHERPDWHVEFKDEPVHISSVEKESIHHYIVRLQDDMTPEERRETEKAEKRDRWRDWKVKLDELLVGLKRKLERTKSGSQLRNRKELQEQRNEAKECKGQLEDYEPQIREAMEYADGLLSDGDLDDSEKEQMRRYISTLNLQFMTIHNEADSEKDRLDQLLGESPHLGTVIVEEDLVQEEPIDQQFHERPDWHVEFKDEPVHISSVEKESIHHYIVKLQDDMTPEERREAEKAEKRDRWRDWKVKLDDLLVGLKRKLERTKSGSQLRNRKELQEQRNEAKECKGQLEDYEPQIREAMEYADGLLSDGDLDDSEKEQMRRYISTLNLQFMTIHNEADSEKDRLDQLLGESPHLGTVIVEEDLVQEEPIDQQFHERPDWHVEFKDEPVHISSVEKESIHHYIVRLQDDMTPEERREAEKDEKHDRWGIWKNKLDDLLDGLRRKLNRAKSREPPRNKVDVQAQIADAKDCKEEVEAYFPQVREAITCANDLIDGDDLNEREKDEIRLYISTLEIQLMTIQNEADEEANRLNELLDKTPYTTKVVSRDLTNEEPIDRHVREIPDWDVIFHDEQHSPDKEKSKEREEKEIKEGMLEQCKTWRNKLDSLLDRLKEKLKNVKSNDKPKNKSEVEEQRDLVMECKDNFTRTELEIWEAVDYANDFLDYDDLEEDVKDEIRLYISKLDKQLLTIQKETQEEDDRLDDVFDDARNEKLERWANYRDKLTETLNSSKEYLADMKSKETTETPEEQLTRAEVFLDKISKSKPQIQESFEYGNKLLEDDSISDGDKDNIEDEIQNLQQAFQDVKYEVDDQYEWLKVLKDNPPSSPAVAVEPIVDLKPVKEVEAEPEFENLVEFTPDDAQERERRATEKEERLDRWRNWRHKLAILLDQLKTKLDRVKSRDKPRDRKMMQEMKNEAKECKEEVERADQEIKEALGFANHLLDDDDLEEGEKNEIRRYISTLELEIRTIEREANDEEESLDNELQQHDVENKGKLDKWIEWKEKMKALLDVQRNKLDNIKRNKTATHRKDIYEQIVITKECEKALQSSNPEVKLALEYGHQLGHDDMLDYDEQDEVKKNTDELEEKLTELRNEATNEREKLYMVMQQLVLQKNEKLSKWSEKKRTSRLLLKDMQTKVEALQLQLKPQNKNEIDKRLTEVENFDEEIEAVKTEVASCINQGHQLLDDGMLDKEDKDKVHNDIDELQDDLENLTKNTADENNNLENLLEGEEADKMERLQKYRKWKNDIEYLFDKLRENLKGLSKMEEDLPKDKDGKVKCMEWLEEFSRDLKKCEEEVNAMRDYGNALFHDDVNNDETQSMETELKELSEEFTAFKQDTGDKIETLSSKIMSISEDEADNSAVIGWYERFTRITYGLKIAERRLDDHKEPTSKEGIIKKLEEIKELNIGFSETEPKFFDIVGNGKELLDDEAISDQNRLIIEDDILWMTERWHELNNKAASEEQRLEGILAATEEQSRDPVAWHLICDALLIWTDDMLALLDTRAVSPSLTLDITKKQQIETEDALMQLMEKEVEVNGVIDDGNKLLDDDTSGIEEKQEIHDKMSKLHDDWYRLFTTVSSREKKTLLQASVPGQ